MATIPSKGELFPENAARMARAIDAAGLDAAIIASPVNVAYASGAFLKTQTSIPERLAIVLLEASGRATFLSCDIEEPLVRRETWIQDVRTYVEFSRTPIEVLADLVAERGLAKGRLGIEMDFIVATYLHEMKALLGGATLVPVDDTLDEVRCIKSKAELELMEHATRVTERVLYEAFADFRMGQSEEQLGWRIREGLRDAGSSMSLLTVVSGPATAIPHMTSSREPIARGAMIKVDMGGIFAGYTSDFARVVYAGAISAEQEQRYDTYVDIYEDIVAGIRPGITAGDLYEHMRVAHERRGMTLAAPHVGHSLGIGLHDEPLLHPKNQRLLRENMLLAIEPRAMLTEGERIHLEDVVLVSADGPVLYTDLARLRTTKVVG